MSPTDAAASSNMKMVFLKSSDGETFEVEERVALQSKTICMIEDDNTIYLPNVSGKILAKVIEYCKGHVGEKKDEDIRIFDTEFVNGIDQKTLFDLLLAANYLEINSLLDLTCKTVEDFLKGFTLEAVRKLFNINNDFTEEEEAEVHRGNSWAFE